MISRKGEKGRKEQKEQKSRGRTIQIAELSVEILIFHLSSYKKDEIETLTLRWKVSPAPPFSPHYHSSKCLLSTCYVPGITHNSDIAQRNFSLLNTLRLGKGYWQICPIFSISGQASDSQHIQVIRRDGGKKKSNGWAPPSEMRF